MEPGAVINHLYFSIVFFFAIILSGYIGKRIEDRFKFKNAGIIIPLAFAGAVLQFIIFMF